jgi:hypothetical protein
MAKIALKYTILNALVSLALVFIGYYAFQKHFHWNLNAAYISLAFFCLLSSIGVTFEIRRYVNPNARPLDVALTAFASIAVAGVIVGVTCFIYSQFINQHFSQDMVSFSLGEDKEYRYATGAESEGAYMGAMIQFSPLGMLLLYPVLYQFCGVIIGLLIFAFLRVGRHLTMRCN